MLQPERTREEMAEVLSWSIDVDDKYTITKKWMKEEREADDVATILKLLYSAYRNNMAIDWIKKEERTREDVVTVLGSVPHNDTKYTAIKDWIRKNERTREDVEVVVRLVDDYSKDDIIREWVRKKERTREDVEVLVGLVPNETKKLNIIKDWLQNSSSDLQTKYTDFVKMAKERLFIYDIKNIVNVRYVFQDKSLQLCKDLYPDCETFQAEFFGEFVERCDIEFLTTQKSQLTTFISELKEDDAALEALNALKRKRGFNLTPQEILELASTRLSSKYESLAEILKSKTAEEALTEDGLKAARETFPSQDLTIVGLFSYYDSQNQLADFKLLLKQEILDELHANFAPSNKEPFIQKSEVEKLAALFGKENLALPSVKIIGDPLSQAVAPMLEEIKKLKVVSTYQLKSAVLSEEQKQELSQKFREIFADPTKGEVADFFEKALNPAGEEKIISADNQEKLFDFFKANKHFLAHIFSIEDGLDNFSATIATLGHGCVSNIATQAKIALFQAIITDPHKRILFDVFREKIVAPILNYSGDQLTGSSSGINILQDEDVVKHFISPTGLVKALSEEFYRGGKIVNDPWDQIQKKVGNGAAHNLAGKISNEQAANLAAYIIIQSTVPDLLDNKYLRGFAEEHQGLINAATKDLEALVNALPTSVMRKRLKEARSVDEKLNQAVEVGSGNSQIR